MLKPLTIISMVLEIMFLAAIARFTWRQRTNKLVFLGWLVLLGMLVLLDYRYLIR